MLLPQLLSVIIQSPMRNGFCTFSCKEMVLLRLHLASCAPILSLLSRLAYITLTGGQRSLFQA